MVGLGQKFEYVQLGEKSLDRVEVQFGLGWLILRSGDRVLLPPSFAYNHAFNKFNHAGHSTDSEDSQLLNARSYAY